MACLYRTCSPSLVRESEGRLLSREQVMDLDVKNCEVLKRYWAPPHCPMWPACHCKFADGSVPQASELC